jgi:two-component system cell cycle sensor histidine kinase/response regulator CckA
VQQYRPAPLEFPIDLQENRSAAATFEQRYRLLAENTPAIVLRYDSELRLVYANPQAQQLTAIPLHNLPGRTNREAGIPEQLCLLWDESLQQVFHSGVLLELDCEFPAGEGLRTFQLKLLPETGPAGEIQSVLAIASERLDPGGAAHDGEDRFRIMADGCPSLIWVTGAEGKTRFLNRQYRRFFSSSPDQMDDVDWQSLIHPEDAPAYIGDFINAVRDRSPYQGSARVRHADGEWRWVTTFAEPRFSANGDFLGHVGVTVDITGQRQAESRFRSLFENMQEGIAYCRVLREPGKPDDYRYLAVNPAFETLTGLKQAVGKKVSELIPGIQESNPELFEIYGRVASTGKPESFETRVHPVNMYFSISVYCPREGHFVAILTDITERKLAEEALRETNRRLEFATAAGHLGIWERDLKADLSFWNDKMYELYGVSKESFVSCRSAWLNCLHPDDRAAIIQADESALRGERDLSHDYRVVHPDGTIRHIKADGLLLRDADGKPIRVIGLNRDITESRLALARLDESEKRFRQVVEGAPQGIFVQIDGIFRYVNPAALTLFGAATPEQLLGQPFMDRVHPDSHTVIRGRLRALREELQPVPLLEERYLRLDGTIFDVEVTAAPFTFEGTESAIVFFRDITSRKLAEVERGKLEEQFRQAQKMESIGRLAGGVAHDFNNLLTVINGYSDLLSRTLREGDPLVDWVSEIAKAGDKAASLTRQLLAFSRKQILVPKPFDLGAMVAENREMLHRLLGEDIELVTTLAPGLSRVMADPGQLHQVLMNLVVNARDAMPSGGRLTIETAGAEHSVMLSVSDTGSGIDQAIQDRIFDPFFTTKGEGEGTGLGLSTVYGIVEQCGGSISLVSEPGKGATFRISLPSIDPAEGAHEIAEPDRRNLRGAETILVVEDQESVRKLVVRTLKSYGYRVLEASHGAAALDRAACQHEPIHLLITDVVMPAMTGKELAESFHERHPETKVVYMSGYGTDVIARRGVLNAGTQFIAKPFAPDALVAKVRETLGPRPSLARILVADGELSVRMLLQKLLEGSGYEVLAAQNADQALHLLRAHEFHVLLTGLPLPDDLRREQPRLKIIAISDASGPNLVGQFGADARLTKPLGLDLLLTTVRRVLSNEH